MNKYYEEFNRILSTENKDTAVNFALDLLKKKTVTLEVLYTELLAPALTYFACPVADKELCIWKEHTRTSIIRTILECTYPYVIERRKLVPQKPEKIVVVCPTEEYHEIGAIIVNHFFLLTGFNSQYIGANTPKTDILTAIRALAPDYLALSVTSSYNLVVGKQITDEIKVKYPSVKIIIGGQAFLQKGALDQVAHDYYLPDAQSIPKMFGEATN
jgi:methanogenic corrinoid protein MtbC1